MIAHYVHPGGVNFRPIFTDVACKIAIVYKIGRKSIFSNFSKNGNVGAITLSYKTKSH